MPAEALLTRAASAFPVLGSAVGSAVRSAVGSTCMLQAATLVACLRGSAWVLLMGIQVTAVPQEPALGLLRAAALACFAQRPAGAWILPQVYAAMKVVIHASSEGSAWVLLTGVQVRDVSQGPAMVLLRAAALACFAQGSPGALLLSQDYAAMVVIDASLEGPAWAFLIVIWMGGVRDGCVWAALIVLHQAGASAGCAWACLVAICVTGAVESCAWAPSIVPAGPAEEFSAADCCAQTVPGFAAPEVQHPHAPCSARANPAEC